MALTLSANLLLLICLHSLFAWLVKRLISTFSAARKVNSSSCTALQGHSPCGYRFLNHSLLVFTNCSFSFSFCLPLPPVAPRAEKEKRVKSGSDGEGASSSQSDSSASLGSLKGGGEPCHPSSRLSLSLPLSVTAIVASGGRKSTQHLSKVGLY